MIVENERDSEESVWIYGGGGGYSWRCNVQVLPDARV